MIPRVNLTMTHLIHPTRSPYSPKSFGLTSLASSLSPFKQDSPPEPRSTPQTLAPTLRPCSEQDDALIKHMFELVDVDGDGKITAAQVSVRGSGR